ncbi:hypothetical protein [Peribacillus frigoritolerans]|uniref:Uncharacterized protein n=1 Tax=Peribacillus castrilensis TaxID=2897690 RepID=A0AAW9NP85_9BACI|nr:hypothetical protein [Peribacillus castrilensis]
MDHLDELQQKRQLNMVRKVIKDSKDFGYIGARNVNSSSAVNTEVFRKELRTMTTDERLYGYVSILQNYLEFVSKWDLEHPDDKEQLKIMAEVIKEIPYYLALDLTGFQEWSFWKKALKHPNIYQWFMVAVNTMRDRGSKI